LHLNSLNFNNIRTYTLQTSNIKKYNIKYLNIISISLILFYVFIYPPFRISSIPVFIPLRLTIETLVLIYLVTKTQLVTPGKLQVNLLLAVIMVLLFGIFGAEPIRYVLSFLNKLLFFFLLIKVFQDDYKLMVSIRKAWVYIWFLISFSAIVALIGNLSGLLSFYKYDFYDSYAYQFNPFVGSIKFRGLFNYKLQQYVGWVFESGQLAYYFGINIILSKIIYKKKAGYNWFGFVNMIGGLITFSVSFYLFFIFYFIFLVFNKIKMKWLFYSTIIPFIIYYAIYFYQNPELFLFTSMLDRVWRVEGAINILLKMNLMELIFGMGTFQSRAAMGGGFTVGVLGMLLGRGLLLTVFYIFLMIKYTKYNNTLLVYTVYYNLIFGGMFLYPVSFLITVLGYWSDNHEYFLKDNHLTRKLSIYR